MSNENTIGDHWGKDDVYSLIVSVLEKMSKPLNSLTMDDLAPIDHFHARGFPATVELGDCLPIEAQPCNLIAPIAGSKNTEKFLDKGFRLFYCGVQYTMKILAKLWFTGSCLFDF